MSSRWKLVRDDLVLRAGHLRCSKRCGCGESFPSGYGGLGGVYVDWA